MRKLERAVADLRADLSRDKGGLVRVFADQLEAVLDALEAAPVPKPVKVKDPYDVYRNKNGWYHLGITVRTTKKLAAYPSVKVGDEGQIVRHNFNSRYAYGVQFAAYKFTVINLSTDEIEVAV